MKKIALVFLLGAGAVSFISLAACDDDITLSPVPHDSGAPEAAKLEKLSGNADGGADNAEPAASDAGDNG